MQLALYYLFIPTPALIEAAMPNDEEWLLEPEVWTDTQNDRSGPKHPQKEIEKNFWTVFLAKLVSADPESDAHRAFRRRCLELSFAGCWSVHTAHSADPVEDLFSEASEFAALAAEAEKD